MKFSEIMTFRVFPKHNHIKSEGNIEKNYSKLNIFTNNRYLTKILEKNETDNALNWLIRHNGDILIVFHNNLHFKAFLKGNKLSTKRALEMINALDIIKSEIYKKDVLEY